MMRALLTVAVIATLVCATLGESAAAVETLKAKVASGEAAAPCNKGAPAGPAPPRQFLDQRLPHVVDDYHPPKGGFNPTDIPSKEVDVAARKILREIQKAEKEAKANGDAPAGPATTDGILSTEEHKALKQLLLDSDILVRAAAKALSENGPIEAEAVKKVAKSAVKKAAKLEKKAAKKKIKKLQKATKKAAAAAKTVTKAAPAPPAASKKADKRPTVKAPAPQASATSGKADKRQNPPKA